MSSGPLAKTRPKLVGQIAAALFIGTGAITLATAPLPGPVGFNRTGTVLVGALAIAAGIATSLLHWDRLPASATLWLVPLALGLICFGNIFGGTMPYTYGMPFVLVFVWIGIAHPRKASILFAPLATFAYVLPFHWLPGDVLENVSATGFSIPVCVLVGETLAFLLERMARAEEARRESDERFRSIVETTSEWIWETDTRGLITYANPAIHEILGYSPDEVIGRDSFELVSEEDREAVRAGFRELAGQARGWSDRLIRWRHKDGTHRFLESTGDPVLGTDGRVIGYRGADRDITDRHRAEQALARTVERLGVLHEIDRSILGASTTLELVTSALARLRQTVECERADVVAFDFDRGRARWVGVSEDRELGPAVGSVLSLDALPPREDLCREPTWHVADARALELDSSLIAQLVRVGIRSFVAAPMIVEGDLLGELFVASDEPHRFTEEDQTIVREVGNQMAVALRHSQLREELISRATQLEELVEEVNRSDRLRHRLLARLVGAQEDERRRIAENIHDDTIQKMSAVGIRLETLRQLLADGYLEQSLEAVDALQSVIEESVRRLRYLMFELRPASLDREGLATALREHLTEAAEGAGFSWEVEDGLSAEPPAGIRAVMYRIAQEALANVRKHARAAHVSVMLGTSNEGITTRVADDGVGFDLEQAESGTGHHLGLASMRERAEIAGGTLTVRSEPGRGTVVEFWLPTPQTSSARDDDGADRGGSMSLGAGAERQPRRGRIRARGRRLAGSG